MRLIPCLALLWASSSQAGPLAISRGTAEISGSATVDLFLGDNNSSVSMTLAPQAGYFLADRAELIGGVGLFLGENASGYGLSVGGRYVAPLGGNHAYAGGTFNYGESQAWWWSDNNASLTALGGFLLPLNQHVGADMGMRINLPLEGGAIHIPLGYLGIAGFFGGGGGSASP